MKTAALSASREHCRARPGMIARVSAFIVLTKPCVMTLALFTAAVRLVIAPGNLDPVHEAVSLVAIAAGAGTAGVLNMWFDVDIDALMMRTVGRPIPGGDITRSEAPGFGLALACVSVVVLAAAQNISAATLLVFEILLYIVAYTIWLKRRTPHDIVVGGVAGALPPVIGWAAATGAIGLEPLVLFLIMFLWTTPLFWALSLTRIADYAKTGVPMLPVVAGSTKIARRILVYSGLLVATSVLPVISGFASVIYSAMAVAGGTALLLWAPRVLLGLAVPAIAQMGVHLVFFPHITTGPDSTNNVLGFALGILIVILVAAGSIFIMANLNDAMMPRTEIMHMPMYH